MARKKRRRGRGSLFNRAINTGLVALAFARPIQILTGPPAGEFGVKLLKIGEEAIGQTGGGGKPFDQFVLARFYGPVAGALALFFVKKEVMKRMGRTL